VALVGYFGWGNFGDELFLRVFRQELGEHFELVMPHDLIEHPYYSSGPARALARCSAVVIGGGDLIIPWQYSGLYWRREYLELPVFITGVGVPNWGEEREDVVQRLRGFFQHANVRRITARDRWSSEWISNRLQPRVAVDHAPDLVCALNLPKVRRKAGKTMGIATRYRRGHDPEYSRLRDLVKHAIDEGWVVRQIVLGRGKVGAQDRRDALSLGVDDVEFVMSEEIDDLVRAIGACDVLYSMKFHGTVIASMYGTPSHVLVPTWKNRAFMELLGRPELLSHFNADDLLSTLHPVPQRHDPRVVADLHTRAKQELAGLREALIETTRAPAGS
jgi:polysaccharide pyruvyl transferase WcaK-like protein